MDILSEVRVIFTLKNALEDVYLVGNCEKLGNWNPRNGVRLLKLDGIHCTIAPIKLLKNSKLEYKYVSYVNGNFIWETISNRKLTPKSNLLLQDAFNSSISYHDYSQKHFEKSQRASVDISTFKITSESFVIVSMHLPVKISKQSGTWKVLDNNSPWHSQLYSAAKDQLNFLWLGFPGFEVPEEDQPEITQLLSNYHCVPVFIPSNTLHFHSAYCDSFLFKVFNNAVDIRNPMVHEHDTQQWEGYKILNILFSDALFNIYTNQIVWIHGIELFLLPSFISRKVKDPMNIGFYLHRPFPSSEIFRVLPHKITILNALCCCDVIGFQIFEHASHFITTCKRILGVESKTSKDGCTCLSYFGRDITVYIGHVGILPEKILEVQKMMGYEDRLNEIKMDFRGKFVIFSLDHVSPLAGLTLKMEAIKRLYKGKRISDNVIFVQVLIPNMQFKSIIEQIINDADEVNRLQEREAVRVVVKDITLQERYAYMEASSGLIVGSIREGLCLLPFEYLYLKRYQNSGILLSEFAGSSRTLSSPYKVNPFSVDALECGILELINNLPSKLRLDKDLAYINTKTTSHWALNFLSQVKSSKKNTLKYQYVPIGMGDTLRVMAIPKDFFKLDEYQVLCAYKNRKNRVLFFDVEGTLLNFIKDKESFQPSNKILSALEDLCSDTKNAIVTITGRERSILNKWFSKVNNLSMAAEYGAYIKINSNNWESFVGENVNWKECSKQIIESYVQRTEGSFIIVKESSVVFNYRDADSGFAQWQAKDLVLNLENLLNLEDCEVLEGERFVEVRPKNIDKGTTMCRVLQKIYKTKGKVDFVFTIGDDASDEKMFKMIKKLKKRHCEWLSPDAKIFSCTFGMKPSEAMYYFLNADEVLKLMELLSASGKRAHSLGNLVSKHSNYHFTTVNVNSLSRKRKDFDSPDITDIFSPNFNT